MPDKNGSQLHVGLLWHTFGHGNLGVDALSRTNSALIEAAARAEGHDVRFTLFGGGVPTVPPALPNNVRIGPSPSLKALLKGDLTFARELGTCDVVFDIGEGDSFTDIYGAKRFTLQVMSKLTALTRGVPLVLSPQTIGPFNNPLFRRVAVSIMNQAHAVYARDHLSKAFLDQYVSRSAIDEFIDVAFSLPFERATTLDGPLQVGINVSGLLFNGGYSGRNELGLTIDYARFTRELIQQFIDGGAEVSLFAHVADRHRAAGAEFSRDDDQSAIEILRKEFPTVQVAPLFASSSVAKGWMSGLDFVVAGRMHACIGAFSAGVPVVPIAYSRKFNGLFNSLKYPFMVDGKSATTDAAVAAVLDLFDRRDELRAALETGNGVSRQKLDVYRSQLRKVLGEASRRVRR